MYEFLQGLLVQFPQYSSLPFFITGESYAGIFIVSVNASSCISVSNAFRQPFIADRILQATSSPGRPTERTVTVWNRVTVQTKGPR